MEDYRATPQRPDGGRRLIRFTPGSPVHERDIHTGTRELRCDHGSNAFAAGHERHAASRIHLSAHSLPVVRYDSA